RSSRLHLLPCFEGSSSTLLILPKHLSQAITNLPNRGIGLHCLQDCREQVFLTGSHLLNLVQRALHRTWYSFPLNLLQGSDLVPLDCGVILVDGDELFLFGDEFVDSNNHSIVIFDRSLILVS